MIYVPDNLGYNSCYSFFDGSTIRVYDRQPQLESGANYIDIYINSHYVVSPSNYIEFTESVPVCISSNQISSNWIYRNDLFEILGSIAILCCFLYFMLFMPIKAFFKGGNR